MTSIIFILLVAIAGLVGMLMALRRESQVYARARRRKERRDRRLNRKLRRAGENA
jgi:hypothetical protein